MATLQDIIQQIRGVSYKPEDIRAASDADAVALLRANNIKDGKLNFDDVVYIDKGKVKQTQYLKSGDVLICASSGSKELVGKAAYVAHDLPMTFGAFCKVARPKTGCPQYIGHYFESPHYRFRISEAAAGVNINNIRNEDIAVLDIPFPSIDEQMEIASVLDKIGALADFRKQQLAKLDELVKARFVELFGTPEEMEKKAESTIQEIADVQVGLVIKPTRFYSDVQNNNRAFRSLNVGEMRIIDSDWVYFTDSGMNQNPRTIVHTGDVLVVRSGYPGTSCVVTEEYAGSNVIDLIIAHPHTDKILPEYLSAFTNFPHGKRQINAMQHGIAQKHFNVGMYENMKISIPPIEQQKRFLDFLQQVDKTKQAVSRSLNKLETLQAALMQHYFG